MANQILKVMAKNKSASWALYSSDLEGQRDLLRESDQEEPLALTPLREDTIKLLVQLQHLLADILAHPANEASAVPARDIDEALNRIVTVLGQQLYEVLFGSEKLRDTLENTLRNLPPDDLLRVELELLGEARKLLAWPWEYLCNPSNMDRANAVEFLALRTQLVLTRWLSFEVAPAWTLTTVHPKVLLVIAAPAPGKCKLGAVVATAILTQMQSLRDNKRIELLDLIEPPVELVDGYTPTASFRAFDALVLKEQPDIIHFIGHGRLYDGKGHLAFVARDGSPDWIDDKRFAQAARQSKELKLVFLQACESALPDPHSPFSGVALELAMRSIPAVVAMQAKIENQVANTFACAFYQALAEGNSVDCAVRKGRANILADLAQKDQALAFGVPVLYLRSYKRLIGENGRPIPHGISRVGEAVDACPRCSAPIRRQNQKNCTNCGLGFWCTNPSCAQPRLDNPLGAYCGECRTRIPGGPEDRIQDEPLPQTAPAAVPAVAAGWHDSVVDIRGS